MVFRSRGTLCGRGGKGDFEAVAIFDLFKSFCAPKSSEVLGKPEWVPIISGCFKSMGSQKYSPIIIYRTHISSFQMLFVWYDLWYATNLIRLVYHILDNN